MVNYDEEEDYGTSDEDVSQSTEHSRPRPGSAIAYAHHTSVNENYPSVIRTETGVLAEYRCMHPGCLANGFWRDGKFCFYRGIVGLCKHYGQTSDHPNYSRVELATKCVYHELDERETAAVLGQSNGVYVIEKIWAGNRSNKRDKGCARSSRSLQDASSGVQRLSRVESHGGSPATGEDLAQEIAGGQNRGRSAGSDMDDEEGVMKYESQD